MLEEPLQIYFQNRLEKLTLLHQKKPSLKSSNQPPNHSDEDEKDPEMRNRMISFDVDEVVDNLAKATKGTNLRKSAMLKSYSGDAVQKALRSQKSATNVRTSWDPKGSLMPLKNSNMENYRKLRMQRVREYSMSKKLKEKMQKSQFQGSQMEKFKLTDQQNDRHINDSLRFQQDKIRQRLKMRRDKSISRKVERSKSSFDSKLARRMKSERGVRPPIKTKPDITKSLVHKTVKDTFFVEKRRSFESKNKIKFSESEDISPGTEKLREFLFRQNPENQIHKQSIRKKSDQRANERNKKCKTLERGRWSQDKNQELPRPKFILIDSDEEIQSPDNKPNKEDPKLENSNKEEENHGLKTLNSIPKEIIPLETNGKLVSSSEEDIIAELKLEIIRKDTEEQQNQKQTINSQILETFLHSQEDIEVKKQIIQKNNKNSDNSNDKLELIISRDSNEKNIELENKKNCSILNTDLQESTVIASQKIKQNIPQNPTIKEISKETESEKLKNKPPILEKQKLKSEIPLVSSKIPEIKSKNIKELKKMEFELKKKKKQSGHSWVPSSAAKYEELKKSLFTNNYYTGKNLKTGSGYKKPTSKYANVTHFFSLFI